MNDQTARLVHWLSDGKSAALVAPAVKAATSPAARGVVNRARAGDLLDEIDVERARRVVQRLGDDPEFRRGVGIAARRVRTAVERSQRRRRGGRFLLMAGIVAAIAAGVWTVMRRPAAGGPAGHTPDGAAASRANDTGAVRTGAGV